MAESTSSTARHGKSLKVLVVGASGSIGSLVVAEALVRGHKVRALVRSEARGKNLPEGTELAIGDLTKPETLQQAVEGVEAVVFTHGSDGNGKAGAEHVDYGGVLAVLTALGPVKPRVALMTAIGVTDRVGEYNRSTESHDWKRRAERLVRAGGFAYTIVRPGWFDYNSPEEQRLVFLQGDLRRSGTPKDGVIARKQIAEVLVTSLTSDAANGKTFELIAEQGPAQPDLEALFAALDPDNNGFDGVRDQDNQPLEAEPAAVQRELAQFSERR